MPDWVYAMLALPFAGWTSTSIMKLIRSEASTKEAIERIDVNITELKEGQNALITHLLNRGPNGQR